MFIAWFTKWVIQDEYGKRELKPFSIPVNTRSYDSFIVLGRNTKCDHSNETSALAALSYDAVCLVLSSNL